MLPVPAVSALAQFTGRDEATFGPFAAQALAQATLMFGVVTKLTALPADADMAQLATNAILEMADRIFLEQPYAATSATPFQSETIGSYSYSKGSDFLTRAGSGQKVGLLWWDLALDELTPASAALTDGGSINVFDRAPLVLTGEDEQRHVYTPAEVVAEPVVGFYNANTR